MVTINLESTTSTMVDKELTTHRQFTVDNWSTMVDKVDKLSTRSTRSTNRAQQQRRVWPRGGNPSSAGVRSHVPGRHAGADAVRSEWQSLRDCGGAASMPDPPLSPPGAADTTRWPPRCRRRGLHRRRMCACMPAPDSTVASTRARSRSF